ncbi:transient receptor potential cation channel subfamily M member 2-like isoform X3 [Convolutriloba macropyga]|uniref:transient receptor potential cation channel subfamily M member 2-like isoform X3 n=1 Tax=Convolutriloba macropyga TaxID=536237 RepID=UPI003F52608B
MGGQNVILYKMFDCNTPSPWPCKERLKLVFRLIIRRSSSVFQVFKRSTPHGQAYPCQRETADTMISCLREALEIEKSTFNPSEYYVPPVVIETPADELQEQKKDPEIFDIEDQKSPNEEKFDESKVLYQVFVIFGDNMEFLNELMRADLCKTDLFVMQGSGYASKKIAQVCKVTDCGYGVKEPPDERWLRVYQMKDRITWIDLGSTQKVYDSLIGQLNDCLLKPGEKLTVLIDWGQAHRACHIIKQLKMTAKGRLIMREHFWPTFCRLFSMGDACAIETLVYHEIVNFRTEMTEDILFTIYQLITQQHSGQVFKEVVSYTNNCVVYNDKEKNDWKKLHDGYIKVMMKGYLTEGYKEDKMANYAYLFHLALLTLNKRLSIVNELCANDIHKLQRYLIGGIADSFKHNVIVAAQMARFNRFFAQKPVLDLMLEVWTGQMKNYVTNKNVVCGLLCPFVIPFLEYETSRETVQNMHTIHSFTKPTPQQMTECKDHSDLRCLSTAAKFSGFYNSPITKFWSNFIVHAFVVAFFANFMMSSERFKGVNKAEYATFAYAIGYVIEEIYQLFSGEGSIRRRISQYFGSQPNLCDLGIVTFFLSGFGIRVSQLEMICSFNAYHLSDVAYSICLIMCFFRILFYLVMFPSLGPYIIMLSYMIRDLTAFLAIMFTMVLGFGIGMESILSGARDVDEQLWKDLWGFLMKPTMQMYGFTLFLEDITNAFNCTESGLSLFSGCPDHDFRPHVLVGMVFIFYLFTGIILLNLLIAIFSDTYSRVRENTSLYWNYVFYNITVEFTMRVPAPSPISIVLRSYQLLKWAFVKIFLNCFKSIRRKQNRNRNMDTYQQKKSVKITEDLRLWADAIENKYIVDTFFKDTVYKDA